MPGKPYRTNPTGLKRIERKLIALAVHEDTKGKIDEVSAEKVDLSSLGLPPEAELTLIAYSGFDEKRIPLGTVAAPALAKNVGLKEIDTANLLFRLLITPPGGHKLLASCEGLRPANEELSGSRPLLAVQYEPLGERMWYLYVAGGAAPILKVNDDSDLDLKGAFEGRDPLVRGAIVPQAFEQALFYLVLNPPSDDDPGHWQNRWKEYLRVRSIEVPEPPADPSEIEEKLNWAKDTATAFAGEVKFVTQAIEKKRSTNHAQTA